MDNAENEHTSDNSISVEEDSKKLKKTSKLEIPVELKEKLEDLPDVLKYIVSLQKYLEKQKRKIKKLKRLKKTRDVETQTSSEDITPKSIAEEITEAAQLETQKLGFAYDESSGLYYDHNTGYYYNAEYGLYYDRNSGTYMTYNQDTKTYEFYSKVELPVEENEEEQEQEVEEKEERLQRKTKVRETKKAVKRKRASVAAGLEEGECSNSSSGEEIASQDDDDEEISSEISNSWPCMRLIVKTTTVPTLKEGSLHLLTYEGGTLGREGAHSILIPDINVSKFHAKFTFDEDKRQFFVTDMGSRNGTVLNGKRLSASKQESGAAEVVHGSCLQIGATVLLCHVHAGHQTCGHCEPGLVQKDDKQEQSVSTNKTDSHKTQLNKLRKKFGVSAYEEKPANLPHGYTDRAQIRRDTVGSQNPHEKTQVASVTEAIPVENKGFKMLAKMGWSQGQSLGKRDDGLTEPINVVGNEGTAGVGSNSKNVQKSASEKQKLWKKAQERFEKLPDLNDLDGSV